MPSSSRTSDAVSRLLLVATIFAIFVARAAAMPHPGARSFRAPYDPDPEGLDCIGVRCTTHGIEPPLAEQHIAVRGTTERTSGVRLADGVPFAVRRVLRARGGARDGVKNVAQDRPSCPSGTCVQGGPESASPSLSQDALRSEACIHTGCAPDCRCAALLLTDAPIQHVHNAIIALTAGEECESIADSDTTGDEGKSEDMRFDEEMGGLVEVEKWTWQRVLVGRGTLRASESFLNTLDWGSID